MVFKRIFQRGYLGLCKKYKGCKDLPLKNFLQVIATGDYKYLYKVKSYENFSRIESTNLSILWNDIILEYAELDNNLEIHGSFENQKVIYQLENLYVVIKAMIRTLMFITPHTKPARYGKTASKTIDDLSKLGYKIDTSSSAAYAASISAADKRANSIISQVNIRKAEMDADNEGDYEKISFEKTLSILNSSLGFQVPEDITVAMYCEYKKVITKKSKNVA